MLKISKLIKDLFNPERILYFLLICILILILPCFIKSEGLNKIYFETDLPLNDWLNCRITGPKNLVVGKLNTFNLDLLPVNWDNNAHRYKWIPTLWGPDIELSLLLPPRISVIPLSKGRYEFSGAVVELGYPKSGSRRNFYKKSKSSRWTRTMIGEVLGKALSTVGGIAISIASAAEAIGTDAERRTILKKFVKDDYEKVPLELPTPDCEFTAPRIRFNLVWNENDFSKPIGILLKATKRTRIGQYKTEYFLLEFLVRKIKRSIIESEKVKLFEDFNNNFLDSCWKVNGSGLYFVENGILRIENRLENDHLKFTYTNINLSKNYQITIKARLIKSGNKGWGTGSDHLTIRINNISQDEYLVTGWRQNEYNDIPLWIETKGSPTREVGLVGVNAYDFDEYQWHLIRVVRKGNTFEAYINNYKCYVETVPAFTGESIVIFTSHGTYEVDFIEVK